MESNKEEAQKCVKIALKAKGEGNHEKAIKFLNKSIKLYPTDEAENLLSSLKSASQDSASSDQSAASPGPPSQSTTMPDFSELHGSSEPETKSYTEEQRKLASRINQCKDYYEILRVQKDSSDSDIKKAYRKMALQLHPDKNFAPGSTEAFKAVGKAFSVLSDPEKRHHYDLYGPDVVNSTTRRRRRHSGSDDDNDAFDPQELFNMFFGGGFPSGNVRVFRRGNTFYYDGNTQRRQEHHQQEQRQVPWIQFLPIIVIVVMSILGNILTPSPAYSLAMQGEYRQVRYTAGLRVKYYVKSDFDQHYKRGSSSRKALENMVESDYADDLRSYCYNERTQKETLRRKGIYLQQKDIISRAENMKTPSCDKLNDLMARLR